jgi:hypothetical protein
MADKRLEDAQDFRFEVSWPETRTSGGDPLLDSSVGKLSIGMQDVLVTAFQSDKGDVGTELTIPLYSVAEWIASNWWPLLFEPRKTDLIDQADDDAGYRSRHWLGYARDGFALPDLWFYPSGDEIEISAYSKYLRYARITFVNKASAYVETQIVRGVLAHFVDDVLGKLGAEGIRNTKAHELWDQIRQTDLAAYEYCQLMGSLGLSPYEEHPEIDRIIDQLTVQTPSSVIADLFDASEDSSLPSLARLTQQVWEALPKAHEIDISPLVEIDLPDLRGAMPWQLGKHAARKVRTVLGIGSTDPQGGHALFEKLDIDPSAPAVSDLEGPTAARLSGGIQRNDDVTMHMALTDPNLARRRFAAARGAYMAWSSEAGSSHLITSTRTRKQQASRAFAAEILAPFDYIRTRAGGSAISMFRVEEIATELEASPAVVRWQAQNNNLEVVDTGTW